LWAGWAAGLPVILAATLAAAAVWAAPATHQGVASCAGSTCHGRPAPSGITVRQNELITWQGPGDAGAHSRAWKVLAQPRAQAIADRLGIGPATRAKECLGCHADPAPPGERGARFQISDGVGCEACHGGSGGWLASHYALGATHAANVAHGMVALETPKARAAVCLDCHYGGNKPGQFATHEIMAAGHPRIGFELELFTDLQRHYDIDADYQQRKTWPSPVKVWAVGQAMALDRALTLYQQPAHNPAGAFPEFYFFDCQSCHRQISDDPKFRPAAQPNPGRPIPVGQPPFNDENMIMLSAAAKVAAPQLSARFEAESRAFHVALVKDRGAAIRAAGELAATSRQLADVFAARAFSRGETLAIYETLFTGESARRLTDYAGAAQAVMAADTLMTALASEGDRAAASRARPDLERAYQAVRDPNGFRPDALRAALQAAAEKARAAR